MIAISADSTCDLSRDLLEQYNIAIAPLYILKEEQAFRDGVDFHPQDIFDYVEKNGKLLKTSAVSVQDYIELFTRLRENAEAVVHINLSSEFSACYQNACLAAREVSEVYVVDSRNLSTGSGLVVLAAADLAAQGVPAAQIKEEMDRLTTRVEASFVVERLDYLYKGGRCSALAALGANLLHLKPCIEVRSGKMGVGKKYRGSFDKALREYVTDRLKGREDIDLHRVFVTHCSCKPETVAMVRKIVLEHCPEAQILETCAGCTISNHCGPNTLGVLFLRKS